MDLRDAFLISEFGRWVDVERLLKARSVKIDKAR